MSNLGYALDGLYSAGWWPSDSDRCTQLDDGRWMPNSACILEAFGDYGFQIRVVTCDESARCRVEWARWGGVRGSVMGRCQPEALLLAFTELVRMTGLASCIS